MKQTKSQRQRTKRVFRWLEDHADRFDMADFVRDKESGESICINDTDSVVKAFESCGTSVCLAGAALCLYHTLAHKWRGHLGAGEVILGVPRELFFSSTWSSKNKKRYYDARDELNYREMVSAAKQECIDWGLLDD